MAYQFGIVAGGEERPAASGRTITVTNPATSEVLGTVAVGDADDVAAAVAAAKAAAPAWAATSQAKRAGYLYALAKAVAGHADELAEIETRDMGKPITVSKKVDLRSAPDAIEYFAGMAGNIEVLKPAEQAPLSPMRLVQLCHEVGIPAGVVNAVPGYGEQAGAALAAHPDVALVAFTGSVQTGADIQRAAADRVAPVLLELGGKSPVIVFEDADVSSAVSLSYAAVFTNQGEVCTAGSRLLVHQSLHEQVVAGLLQKIRDTTVIGDPMDPATTLGPLVDAEQLKRVQGFVDRARNAGAKLLAGGGTRTVDGLDSD